MQKEVSFTRSEVALPAGTREIYGIIRAIDGTKLTVARRDGSIIVVDASGADKTQRYAEPYLGNGVILQGRFAQNGVFEADMVLHAKKDAAMWPADR